MIVALVLWGTFALIFVGIGLWFTRQSPWRTFWYGWLAVIVCGQIWNLFAPWHTLAQLAMFAAGLGGLWRYRQIVHHWLQAYRVTWIGLLLVLLLLANGAVGVQDKNTIGFDTGLYHLQSVRWIQHSATINGLGNLHERLAFNNGFSFYPALIMTGGYEHTGYGLAYGLLFGMALAGWIDAVLRRAASWQTAMILVGITAFECVFAPLYGLMTDPAVWLLGAILFWEVIQRDIDRRLIWLMVGVMIAIKWSAVVLALGLGALTLRNWRHIRYTGWALLAIVPAVIRSVIVSGYALFPLSATRLPVAWAMPVENVQDTAAWIASWARTSTAPPEVVLNNPNWIADYWLWHTTHGLNIAAYFVPTIMALLIGVVVIRHWATVRGSMLIILSATIAYWFISAPDIRFAGVALWLVPLTLSLSLKNPLRLWLPALAVLGAIVLLHWPFHDLLTSLPVAPTDAIYQDGMYIALADGQCWDAPIPCAIGFNRVQGVVWRGQTLADGFIQAGHS